MKAGLNADTATRPLMPRGCSSGYWRLESGRSSGYWRLENGCSSGYWRLESAEWQRWCWTHCRVPGPASHESVAP